MNFLWTSYELLMNFSWTFYELFMNFWQTCNEFLTSVLWVSFELLMSFLQTSYKLLTSFFQTSFKPLSNFFLTSYRLLLNFFHTSWKLLTNLLSISYNHSYIYGVLSQIYHVLGQLLAVKLDNFKFRWLWEILFQNYHQFSKYFIELAQKLMEMRLVGSGLSSIKDQCDKHFMVVNYCCKLRL